MLIIQHAWRLRAATVVIASALLLAACAGQSKAPDAGGHGGHRTAVVSTGTKVTVMRTFVPFRPDGAPAAGVAAHRSGSCFTTSITVGTRDAYRCLAGNTLLDPCFARSHNARNLYCYTGPWSAATRLHLTKPLESAVAATTPMRFTHPWAITLTGGIRCVASGGTTNVVRGVALSYQCGTGQAGLYGSNEALQTALFSGRNGALHTVDVAVEWRG